MHCNFLGIEILFREFKHIFLDKNGVARYENMCAYKIGVFDFIGVYRRPVYQKLLRIFSLFS